MSKADGCESEFREAGSWVNISVGALLVGTPEEKAKHAIVRQLMGEPRP
jgi:hypothetical protein